MKRRTIQREISLSGTGLHKGEKIELTLKPNGYDSKTGRGIIFKRVDVTDKDNIIKVDYKNLFDLERGTNIKNEADVRVHTIEHFMSSLSVSGITDIIVEINGNELPILDGSSIQFMKKLEEAGIKELESEIEPVVITEPVIFTQEKDGKHVLALPYDGFKISYTIDFNHSFLKSQYFEIDINSEEYIEKIARCRTFAFDYEIDFLKKNNLALGGSLENAIVVGKDGPLNSEGLRYPDEFVRHKILDIIGDLYVLGRPIKAHVIAIKAGHFVNAKLTALIAEKYLK
jgi:UDP-3-O-[3-hydroxymyristoyl] N-acetylglucosamine deacetylase